MPAGASFQKSGQGGVRAQARYFGLGCFVVLWASRSQTVARSIQSVFRSRSSAISAKRRHASAFRSKSAEVSVMDYCSPNREAQEGFNNRLERRQKFRRR